MRRSFWAIAALTLVTACKPTVPSGVIQPDDMEELLYDYHVTQAVARVERTDNQQDFNRTKYFYAVLKKHGVTEAEFDSSLVYYYSHVEYLKKVYTRVGERLSDEAKSLGASVGEIGRYSQYSATGDTANIWTDATDVLLMPRPTANRFDFTVKADTSFHKGDSFVFQFMTDFLWQTGTKDAVVCVVSKYEGDSVIQKSVRVTMPGITQLRIPANRKDKLKELAGFIYLADGGDNADVRRMMFVSQMQLIRFHNKIVETEKHDTTAAASVKEDSLQRSVDATGTMLDTVRSRVIGRRAGGMPLPAGRRVAPNGMEARPVRPEMRR